MAEVLVTDPSRLDAAEGIVRAELAALDRACGRFRADSDISRLHVQAGRQVRVEPLLAEALAAALRAARLTGGLIDPTDGAGWHRVLFDPRRELVVLPRGVRLDLDATAHALVADRVARRVHDRLGCGTLVSHGGDVRAAGDPPPGGWRVTIAEDVVVTLTAGGLATVSGEHVVGSAPPRCWRTVSVLAKSTVDAAAAAAASLLLGEEAPKWLSERKLPARLVRIDGEVVTTASWPDG